MSLFPLFTSSGPLIPDREYWEARNSGTYVPVTPGIGSYPGSPAYPYTPSPDTPDYAPAYLPYPSSIPTSTPSPYVPPFTWAQAEAEAEAEERAAQALLQLATS